MHDRPSDTRRRGIRWWPAAIVLVLFASWLAWVWFPESRHRQDQIVSTVLGALVTGLALLVWLMLLSRLRWKLRLAVFGGLVALLVTLGLTLEFRGVSGDTLPDLEWRWSRAPGNLPPAEVRADAPRPARTTSAHDYPQFLGPDRDGRLSGPRLARDWSASPPRPLWRQPIGAGWSGFAVVGDHAVTLEQRGEEELVSCYGLKTGELIWVHADRARFYDPIGGLGPRATPAIDGLRVYTLGGTGILNALDLETGERLWSRNILEDNGAGVPVYGVSGSPLVIGGTVVVAAGGSGGNSLAAYDGASGERVWSGGSDPAAYSSPLLAELAGMRQILLLNEANVVGHEAGSGRVLWSYPWRGQTERVSQPVVLPGDRVFVSSGYGVGGKLFRIRREPGSDPTVELLWESRGLKAKMTTVVHRDGFLYGLDDGILVCLDVEDGKRRWKRGRYGHGQVILVDDLILVLGEDGTVALVEAGPEAYRELGRFSALEGKTWGHPALAGRYLLVRNDREAACYELPLEASSATREIGEAWARRKRKSE